MDKLVGIEEYGITEEFGLGILDKIEISFR